MMKINTRQLLVLLIAITLFSMTELFRPWLYEDGWTSAKRSAGYYFIYNPPPIVKSKTEMEKLFLLSENDPPRYFSVQRDFARLYSQRIAIILLMLGFLIVLSNIRSYKKFVIGGILLCLGFAFTALVYHISWSITH
jgi:hypothetical protein